jgi:GLPGLI family protein
MSSVSRRDRETIVEAYVRYDEGSILEAREFLGRTFLIEDERPLFRWKLTGDQAEYLGYVVQKATAEQDSSTVEAWFTPQIPVPGGPAMYGGLPGMILVVSVDGGREQYSATAVSLMAVADGVIVPPTRGEPVSRARYEEIVEEKLEELRTVGGGG